VLTLRTESVFHASNLEEEIVSMGLGSVSNYSLLNAAQIVEKESS
jgi:hypothetical protein